MSEGVAIVGIACRLPGADTLARFAQLLSAGQDLTTRLTDQDLERARIDPEIWRSPAYIRTAGVLEREDLFDAAFFGIPPREAALMDPQHRVFLECAWEALEDAGFAADCASPRIGVFAGSAPNKYLLNQLLPSAELHLGDDFHLLTGNDKDYLTSRVAYKLGLRGPAVTIQTACSTSLVAIHAACESVLSGECDLAIAGGVTIGAPQRVGSMHHKGSIMSLEGRCRAFDAGASGTVAGNGAGAVVLRRLADAVRDGDAIHAVIRGTAINNDGHGKVGFTSPSVQGQRDVVLDALAHAGVDARSISYVEAHGTGTPLGDPIEARALTEAYRKYSGDLGWCALGSVKTNIGHLDAAAGVAGLLKVVGALAREELPPSLGFETPNPAIDFERSPFHVISRRQPWPRGSAPRRAGVSSFGIGGTNAHVIVEEAPLAPLREPMAQRPELILISARAAEALGEMSRRLAAFCISPGDAALCDVAFTLATGRVPMPYRRAIVASTFGELRDRLLHDSPDAPEGDSALHEAGRLWQGGGALADPSFFAGRRVHLPAYPFQRTSHWIEPEGSATSPLEAGAPPGAAFLVPIWRRADPLSAVVLAGGHWLFAANGVAVPAGMRSVELDRLPQGLDAQGLLWMAPEDPEYAWSKLRALVRAWPSDGPQRFVAATTGTVSIAGESQVSPEWALLAGPLDALAREHGVACSRVDLPALQDPRARHRAIASLKDETAQVVALRGGERWIPGTAPIGVKHCAGIPRRLRERGVYVVTGGLGGVGLAISCELVRRARARLVLVQRRPATREALAALDALGAEYLFVQADVSTAEGVDAMLSAALARFGEVHGVIHAAGIPGKGLLSRSDERQAREVLGPKVAGTRFIAGHPALASADFLLLCSSTMGTLGRLGQADYVSACAFQDAFAASRSGRDGAEVIAVDFDRWTDTGMSAPAPAERIVIAADDWRLTDHRIDGKPTLAACAIVDLVTASFAKACGSGPVELEDVVFVTPCTAPPGAALELALRVDRSAGGDWRFTLGAADGRMHATGIARPLDTPRPEAQESATGAYAWDPPPQLPQEGPWSLGPRWSVVKRWRRQGTGYAADLELREEHAADLALHPVHPALLDVATGLAAYAGGSGSYWPSALRRARVWSPLPARLRVDASVTSSEEGVAADVLLRDPAGTVAMHVEGYRLRRVPSAPPRAEAGAPGRPEQGLAPGDATSALLSVLDASIPPRVAIVAVGAADAVRKPAASPSVRGEGDARMPLERSIAATFERFLGISPIGADDDLIALGVDSALFFEIMAVLARDLGVTVRAEALYELSTVRLIAKAAIGAGTRTPEDAARPPADEISEEERVLLERMYGGGEAGQ